LIVARRTLHVLVLVALIFFLTIPSAFSADRIQRSVAVAEAFVPVALLITQGTDTPFELGVFGASVVLQSVPNVLMLIGESTMRPELTRIARWANFGIDSSIAAGLFGVGIAYLAGAFGPDADIRSRGGFYLALSLPAAVAAFVDFLPYSVESRPRSEPATASSTSEVPTPEASAVPEG
jgi:hypothetical protein